MCSYERVGWSKVVFSNCYASWYLRGTPQIYWNRFPTVVILKPLGIPLGAPDCLTCTPENGKPCALCWAFLKGTRTCDIITWCQMRLPALPNCEMSWWKSKFPVSCIFVSCIMAEQDSRMPGPLLIEANAAENWRKFFVPFEIYFVAKGKDAKEDKLKVNLLLHCAGPEAIEEYSHFVFTDEVLKSSHCHASMWYEKR